MATKKKPKTKPETKPKKKQIKKSTEKFFVIDRDASDWEELDTLDEAIDFINSDFLAHYMPEDGLPDEEDIVIIKGERIPFRYEQELRAVKIYHPTPVGPLPLPLPKNRK
jgi:hypothetical protein